MKNEYKVEKVLPTLCSKPIIAWSLLCYISLGGRLSFAELSYRVWSQIMPILLIGLLIFGALLVFIWTLRHWDKVTCFVRQWLFRKQQYNYQSIFKNYLERFNSISDRRELYTVILTATCRIVKASGASLIIKDVDDQLQMKATFGLKPFSFDIEGVQNFLLWLEEKRHVVTRTDFVKGNEFNEIKTDALRWFVQFNAEACIPLFIADRLYGVINLGPREENEPFDSETRDLLKLLAIQYAANINNVNLYQALLTQNHKLQEISTFKTQLLANVSHELRTPLTSIIGLAELIAEGGDGPVTSDQIAHLSTIRQSGVRLLSTFNDILDISKISSDRMNLDVQRINLSKVISQVVDDVKPNKYTKLSMSLEQNTGGVYGDEKRIRQVLSHLLDNAAKFTKCGKISVKTKKSGDMMCVSIKDTGIGIDKKQQRLIFEGFIQADKGMAREYNGLGLGLAISQKLIDLLGGRIWMTSKKGHGSQFNFTLPLRPADFAQDNYL